MSPDTIVRFYDALDRGDAATLAELYAPDAHFSDPVFDLHGAEIVVMWQAFILTPQLGLSARLVGQRREGDFVSTVWTADYTYPPTGRSVHHHVHDTFTLDAWGRITAHRQLFNLYAWIRQAVGPVGSLVGWSTPFQRALRKEASAALAEEMARRTGRVPVA